MVSPTRCSVQAAPHPEKTRSAGHNAATIASSPSVSAAGPGCRISADLISTMRSSWTAGISFQPGRFFDPVRHDFLAAPRCQNDIGGGGAHDIGKNNPILGGLLKPQLWAEMNAETRGFSPLTCGGRTA
jgi:hypothetical protein